MNIINNINHTNRNNSNKNNPIINHSNNIIVSSSHSSRTTNNHNGSQACAACKHQRRKCAADCILAPYFPHDRQRQFQNAHKLFGVSNITKIIRHLSPPHKDEAMRTIIFESDVRALDPVGGCYTIIRHLQHQIDQTQAELDLVLAHIAYCRRAAAAAAHANNNNNGISDEDHKPAPVTDGWCEKPSNNMMMNVVYPAHHYHHQPQFLIVQNDEMVDLMNNSVAWGVHVPVDNTPPPSSLTVPTSQISEDSMKPALDLSGYAEIEGLTFDTDGTLGSEEAIVKADQDKPPVLNEDESLSNMLKIMI